MIHKAFVRCSLVFAVLGALCAGCGKPAGGPQSAIGNRQSAILTLHWLGKHQLARDTNALNFMAIWNLPESLRLEAQVLDKLATAPWRLWLTNSSLSNAPIGSLRPLLADLVQHEVYLEACGGTNQPGELVLAIRLPSDRVADWHTNLPAILRSTLGVAPLSDSAAAGKKEALLFQNEALRCELSVAKDWYLVGLARLASTNQPDLAAGGNPAGPLASLRQRIAATGMPFVPGPTNYWLNLEAAVPQLNAAFGVNLPPSVKSLSLVTFSDGENVKIRGGLDLLQALPLPLDAWNVPTNQITQPLTSFSAVRGVRPWLESLGFWQEQKLGAAPNQMFFWAQGGAPWLHFFTAHAPDPTNQFLALKDFVINWVNPELAPNRTGDFGWETNDWRVVWKGVPFCSPALKLQDDWISGGFIHNPVSGRPMPPELVAKLTSTPNLVYYHWETTGPQVNSFVQIGQLMRMAFSRAQLASTNAGLPWLQVLHTNLGYSATSITLRDNQHLDFARSSTLGLSALELHILADWADSPTFPSGLYTFTAPRDFLMNRARPRR